MSVGYQIKEVLEQIMWMGVAFGIVGYFIYREWGRRRESMTMLERMTPEQLAEAQAMAAKVTQALTGAGLWGVEFFLSHDKGVYFSELSPRPHDTGMVTLAGTQNLNEFELHCRAVLGLPIPRITLEHTGASAVILSPIASREQPRYRGEEEVCREENTDLRIFGKPSTKLNRRMGVVVRYDALDADLDALRDKTKAAAAKVEVY